MKNAGSCLRAYCITMRFSARRSRMRAILSMLVALSGDRQSAARACFTRRPIRLPVFRSGVEVMEVDVTVVDGKGMPVRDLRAPEFTVTVDGQPRRVVSAEFISDSAGAGRAPAPPSAIRTCRTTPTGARAGSSCWSIDRNNIDTHTLRGAIGGAQELRQQHRPGRPACR